jgi:hypothetical protein
MGEQDSLRERGFIVDTSARISMSASANLEIERTIYSIECVKI